MVWSEAARTAVMVVVFFFVLPMKDSWRLERGYILTSANCDRPHEWQFQDTPNGVERNATQQQWAFANETVIAFGPLRSPISPGVLNRIHGFANELHAGGYSYRLAAIVDETVHPSNDTAAAVQAFFDEKKKTRTSTTASLAIPLPHIFPVSERIILEEYPKLASYLHNEPEPNANNEPGLCCGKPMMWQMFTPSFALFLKSNPQYKFGWRIEDDIFAVGKNSLVDVLRMLDLELGEHVDLWGNVREKKVSKWRRRMHTRGFADIVSRLTANDERRESWVSVNDAVQRHSGRFARALHGMISNNIFQFGEDFVQPAAWRMNYSYMLNHSRILSASPNAATLYLHRHIHALEEYIANDLATPTLIYHGPHSN